MFYFCKLVNIVNTNSYTVIVVGGGFAGLCAQLFFCNYGINSKVIDNFCDNTDYVVKNYCGFLQINKKQLIEKIKNQISIYNKDFLICNSVEKICVNNNNNSNIINVVCKNITYFCKYVLVCNGFVYKRFDFKNVTNKNLVCDYIDTNNINKYSNKIVIIIGGGDRTITYLECLQNIAKKIIILNRNFVCKTNAYLNQNKHLTHIIIFNNIQINNVNESIFFTDKKTKQKHKICYDFIIAAIGISQNKIPLFYNGVQTDIYNTNVNEFNETNISNVFLAGIAKKSMFQQIINVMHDGSVVAMEIRKRITGKNHIYFE